MYTPNHFDALGIQPGKPTPKGLWLIRKLIRPFVRIAFRPKLFGFENLPQDRPFLLVTNHSGGLGLAEILCFASLYVEETDRLRKEIPMAGFALPLGFAIEPVISIHRMLGSIPSTYEHAFQALEKGVSILIFPGGDHEALRPIWKVHEVDFGKRQGFLRIAHKAGVPIVPMGIRGGLFTAPILFRANWLTWLFVWPRFFGMKRWSVSLLSLVGIALLAFLPISLWLRLFLVWLWAGSPFTFYPIFPASLRFRIGAAMDAETLFAPHGPKEDMFEEAYSRVVQAVQELVSHPSDE